MIPDIDMFGVSLGDRVGSNEYRALVVPANWNWLKAVSELPHEGMHPDNLATTIGERHVLSFSGGQSNGLLCFCCPGYETTCQFDKVT